MRTFHKAAANVQPRHKNFFNIKIFETDSRPNDIHYGIYSSDLVKMHLILRHMMHLALGLSQPLKDQQALFPYCFRKRRRLQHLPYILHGTVYMSRWMHMMMPVLMLLTTMVVLMFMFMFVLMLMTFCRL